MHPSADLHAPRTSKVSRSTIPQTSCSLSRHMGPSEPMSSCLSIFLVCRSTSDLHEIAWIEASPGVPMPKVEQGAEQRTFTMDPSEFLNSCCSMLPQVCLDLQPTTIGLHVCRADRTSCKADQHSLAECKTCCALQSFCNSLLQCIHVWHLDAGRCHRGDRSSVQTQQHNFALVSLTWVEKTNEG